MLMSHKEGGYAAHLEREIMAPRGADRGRLQSRMAFAVVSGDKPSYLSRVCNFTGPYLEKVR